MNLVIILTGTVKPAVIGGNFTCDERFSMYKQTLKYYAKKVGTQYPIIFVENSDADLSSLKEEFKYTLNLEIMQFPPNDQLTNSDFDNSKGKGYNEYLMIKKCLLNSTSINSLEKTHTHFLKITGRYSMINICDIIHEIESRIGNKDIVFMGDIKDTCIYKLLGIQTLSSHWGDSRFFTANINFYKNEMIDCYKQMNDYKANTWAEYYFLNFSRQYRKDPRFIFRYRHQVIFDGISGTLTSKDLKTGINRQNSLANLMKAYIRRCMRILFPNIWF